MKINCTCGNRISDTTDYIQYKGRIISDQDWFDLWDEIEAAIKEASISKDDIEEITDKVFSLGWDISNTIYQCSNCGKLFIYNRKNELEGFDMPSKDGNKRILQSAKGEKWQGFLYGEWYIEKPSWSEHQGYISIQCLVNEEGYTSRTYDSYEDLEKDYYELFNELRFKNALRSSTLKINKEVKHNWCL